MEEMGDGTMKKNGFTLIELLVVIAILGILMGLMLPAGGAIINKAKRSTAKGDAQVVQTALMRYRAEYNAWPKMAKGKLVDHFTDEAFMDLMVPAAVGEPPADNLKRIRFLEGGKGAVGGKEGEERAFRDPWGKAYQYLVNETPQDTMDLSKIPFMQGQGYEGPNEVRTSVLVWSAGPDGDHLTWKDNVASWDY
jgi:prepilin-type N-terminal cleavage/methylation domain-containing protein